MLEQSENQASYQTAAQLEGRADQDGHIPLGAIVRTLAPESTEPAVEVAMIAA
jgi:hypothetical protein